MKGIYELRSFLPRYTATWDSSSVLNYFRKGASVSALSMKELTLKLTFLLTLLSGQRCQTVTFFSINNMRLSDLKCTFVITEKVKQSRVGIHLKPVEFWRIQKMKSYVLLNIHKSIISKPKFLDTIVINYSLAMSNLTALPARTPYPGGVRMS